MKPMQGKVCLVTGATSGIGKVTAMELAKMGATVVMVVRDRQRGEQTALQIRNETGNHSLEVMVADLSSQISIRQLAEDFKAKYKRLDVLVNNAGAVFGRRNLTVDGIEQTFALNHLAYFLLTNLLLDLLKDSAPSRIVNVSSSAQATGEIKFDDLNADKEYKAIRAYCQSKLANVLFTYELSRRLEGTGVTVNCLHPGVVKTNFGLTGSRMMRILTPLVSPFMISPEKGAETSIYLASSQEVEGVSGKYFIKKKETQSSPKSYDRTISKRLWDISMELTNLKQTV